MKQVIAVLMLLGLYGQASSQQTSLTELKSVAGDAQVACPPASEAVSALTGEMPRREVKFLFSEGTIEVPGPCRVVEQDGERDGFACREFPGKVRCYADVTFNNHTLFRVYGGCTESDADCWWNGSAAVKDACKQIVINPPGPHPGTDPVHPPIPPVNPPPPAGCKVKAQDGVMDAGACQGAPGKIRCYADVTKNGVPSRVYGRCWSAYEDCRLGGVGVVDPCNWRAPL